MSHVMTFVLVNNLPEDAKPAEAISIVSARFSDVPCQPWFRVTGVEVPRGMNDTHRAELEKTVPRQLWLQPRAK